PHRRHLLVRQHDQRRPRYPRMPSAAHLVAPRVRHLRAQHAARQLRAPDVLRGGRAGRAGAGRGARAPGRARRNRGRLMCAPRAPARRSDGPAETAPRARDRCRSLAATGDPGRSARALPGRLCAPPALYKVRASDPRPPARARPDSVTGPRAEPTRYACMSANIYSVLAERFAPFAGKPCLETHTGEVYTYADLERETARLARFFTDLG